MATTRSITGATAAGLALGAALGAVEAAVEPGGAAVVAVQDGLIDVILVEALAEIGADGRRVGPVLLRAAAAPALEAPAGGCVGAGLRGAPVAADLRVQLAEEVGLPWRGELGQHATWINDPAQVWDQLTYREAGVAAQGWAMGSALRTSGPPRAPVGGLRPEVGDELRVVIATPSGERSCRPGAPALTGVAADATQLERWVERAVVLPDGRVLQTRSRLRLPRGEGSGPAPAAALRRSAPGEPRRARRVLSLLPA